MFSELLNDLQENRLPELTLLRKKFNLALTKKIGVMNQPYHCRSNDPKINPPVPQLLLAACLLEESKALFTLLGIILQEIEEQSPDTAEKLMQTQNEQLSDILLRPLLNELLDIPSDAFFRRRLQSQCHAALSLS